MCNCESPCRICKCKLKEPGLRFLAENKASPVLDKITNPGVGKRVVTKVFGGGPTTWGESIFVLGMIFAIAILVHLIHYLEFVK